MDLRTVIRTKTARDLDIKTLREIVAKWYKTKKIDHDNKIDNTEFLIQAVQFWPWLLDVIQRPNASPLLQYLKKTTPDVIECFSALFELPSARCNIFLNTIHTREQWLFLLDQTHTFLKSHEKTIQETGFPSSFFHYSKTIFVYLISTLVSKKAESFFTPTNDEYEPIIFSESDIHTLPNEQILHQLKHPISMIEEFEITPENDENEYFKLVPRWGTYKSHYWHRTLTESELRIILRKNTASNYCGSIHFHALHSGQKVVIWIEKKNPHSFGKPISWSQNLDEFTKKYGMNIDSTQNWTIDEREYDYTYADITYEFLTEEDGKCNDSIRHRFLQFKIECLDQIIAAFKSNQYNATWDIMTHCLQRLFTPNEIEWFGKLDSIYIQQSKAYRNGGLLAFSTILWIIHQSFSTEHYESIAEKLLTSDKIDSLLDQHCDDIFTNWQKIKDSWSSYYQWYEQITKSQLPQEIKFFFISYKNQLDKFVELMDRNKILETKSNLLQPIIRDDVIRKENRYTKKKKTFIEEIKKEESLSWHDIFITLTNDSEIIFNARDHLHKMDLLDEKSKIIFSGASIQILMTMAKNQGMYNDSMDEMRNYSSSVDAVKQRIHRLGDQLKEFFSIESNPISYKKSKGWKANFQISYSDARPRDKTLTRVEDDNKYQEKYSNFSNTSFGECSRNLDWDDNDNYD